MKRNWITTFTTLFIPLALGACSEFEASQHVGPQGVPQIDSQEVLGDVQVSKDSDYVVVDTKDSPLTATLDELVLDIPEINMSVYEVEDLEDIDDESVLEDGVIDIAELSNIKSTTQFWEYLNNKRGLSVAMVGASPENVLKIAEEKGHRITIFSESGVEIYESELAAGIIKAVEWDVDAVFVPVTQGGNARIVQKAIQYSLVSGIPVFSIDGEAF